jgi:hypothetical protein
MGGFHPWCRRFLGCLVQAIERFQKRIQPAFEEPLPTIDESDDDGMIG